MTMSELIQWDHPFSIPVLRRNQPEGSLPLLQGEMNRLFGNFFTDTFFPVDWDRYSFPVLDVIENHKVFKVRAEMPGLKPEDVDIEITDNLLTIKGEKQEEQTEEEDSYLRREASYGSFVRTVTLPDVAYADKAKASYKNGILTVTIPKKAEALKKPKKLQVKEAA